MTRKQQRMGMIVGGLALLAAAAGLILYSISDTLVFFYTPSEVVQNGVMPGTRFRLGGLVEKGSLVRDEGTRVHFTVTDTDKQIPVTYQGVLPDLFREGQGVVAEGKLNARGVFVADTVLAKHDAKYMPKEVADALKKKGVWKEGEKMSRSTTQ